MPLNSAIDLQLFIDHSDDMVGIFDTSFKLLEYNKRLAEIFYKADQIEIKKGVIFSEILPESKSSFWHDQFIRALKGETVKYEFPYDGSSGQFYYMENTYRPVIVDDEVVHVIQTLKVITLKKKFEQKIQSSERIYRHLTSNIPNSDLFLLDEKFNIVIASGTDLKRLGYDPEKFVGQNMYDYADHFGLRLLWEYYDQARNGIDTQVEFKYGDDYYLEDIIALRNEKDQINGYIVFSKRITQQKLNEKKLERINQSKDSILGIVAHDLRNPITAIYSLADLIKNDPNNATEYLALVNKSCISALNIITELLDISELDRTDYALRTESVELISYLKGIINANAILANDKELDIQFFSNISELYIDLNQHKFSRVLNNLLMNAIKFSHRRQKIVVSADIQSERECVIIKVQDFGIGVPDSLKSIIFDKFTKAGRKGTEGEKSLGLGMSIVKRIVELHNGRIWLESKENEGTTVFIELAASVPRIRATQIASA